MTPEEADMPDEAKKNDDLLKLLGAREHLQPADFKKLVLHLDRHTVLAKLYLLEGTPYVFRQSPMKYMVFKEQVAQRFDVGSQDVCIVGSARLGFSPAPAKFGTGFDETSDVDVAIISDVLFDKGSRELFSELNSCRPHLFEIRPFTQQRAGAERAQKPVVDLDDWHKVKDAIRNYVYQNFNPGLLSPQNPLRKEMFDNIGSTAGLFLALEPKVFVSKIRCRIFRTWKAAEDYYANSLHELQRALKGAKDTETDIDIEDGEAPSCGAAERKD
jgi:hypothetical protein